MRIVFRRIVAVGTLLLACAANAQTPVSADPGGQASGKAEIVLRFAFTDDDQAYVRHMERLARSYSARTPGVAIEFITVGYAQLKDQLPMQLAAGGGPDIAKVTDYTLTPYFLDIGPFLRDRETFEALHGGALAALRTGSPDTVRAIPGFISSQTINLPFVNVTLFAQAGEPLPRPGASLDEIVSAAVRVARATGVHIPFAMDRSGHRFSGPALSYGAVFERDDRLVFPDAGAKALIADLYDWTRSGAFPPELWGAAGGSRYKAMADDFISAETVVYFSGNWMVSPFQRDIGDDFEWTALATPCGAAGCFPMSGGTAIVGLRHTKHPQAVAEFLEYLGSQEVQRTIAETFLIIPGAAIPDLEFRTSSESARRALQVFVAETAHVPEISRRLESSRAAQALYAAIVQRVGQLIVGEFTLDETYDRLARDVSRINREIEAMKTAAPECSAPCAH